MCVCVREREREEEEQEKSTNTCVKLEQIIVYMYIQCTDFRPSFILWYVYIYMHTASYA